MAEQKLLSVEMLEKENGYRILKTKSVKLKIKDTKISIEFKFITNEGIKELYVMDSLVNADSLRADLIRLGLLRK